MQAARAWVSSGRWTGERSREKEGEKERERERRVVAGSCSRPRWEAGVVEGEKERRDLKVLPDQRAIFSSGAGITFSQRLSVLKGDEICTSTSDP